MGEDQKTDIRRNRIQPSAGIHYVNLLACGNGRIVNGVE